MNQSLPKKLLFMPSFLRFVLVLLGMCALLVMMTPGAFAASAHSARYASPDDCAMGLPRCAYLFLDEQPTSLQLNPSSADCNPTNEFGNHFECDVTLKYYYQYGGS